jgi:peptidoglycan/xylan/chitin deacetylase (PgdA/CDA1 family)
VLNFHGIGEPDRAFETGEAEYWVTQDAFEQTLDAMLAHLPCAGFGVTFDDGNRSDLKIGAPQLLKRGLPAEFFVLAGKLGQTGYLAQADVRELFDVGFGIGTHGLNHVRWDRLDPTALDEEIMRSKRILEDVVGAPVVAAGLPFGAYNRRVLQTLRRRGFARVYSSDGGPRLVAAAWPTPRWSIRRGTKAPELAVRAGAAIEVFSRLTVEARVRLKSVRP